MKFLPITIAALSIAAIAAVAGTHPPAAGRAIDEASTAKPAQLILAQRYYRYRRCQEDLGYGRTGSYGCG
jgi:hypothetical protein